MNISTGNDHDKSPFTSSDIVTRKKNHLDICNNQTLFDIESRLSSGFNELKFVHEALPEISFDEIDLTTEFLGHKLRLPLFISCMTGGTEEGKKANQLLAKAASQMAIPFGLGSIRVLFEKPELKDDFALKKYAKDVPVLANLGVCQAKEFKTEKIRDLLRSLEVDALVLHLNCGQELFQKGGDRDFKKLLETIFRITEELDYPVIVKETGFGIRPYRVKELINRGVSYVDVAGAGGTNWILVEAESHSELKKDADLFSTWGIPTAEILAACDFGTSQIIASGGIRDGMDLAKSIALGASLGGMALPFIRAALTGDPENIRKTIIDVEDTLKKVMLLTGSKKIADLKKSPLIKSIRFQDQVRQLKDIDQI